MSSETNEAVHYIHTYIYMFVCCCLCCEILYVAVVVIEKIVIERINEMCAFKIE